MQAKPKALVVVLVSIGINTGPSDNDKNSPLTGQKEEFKRELDHDKVFAGTGRRH